MKNNYTCFFQSRPRIPEEYEIIFSHRKTLAIQVKSDWRVFIRSPYRCKNIFIENFVEAKKSWIEEKQKYALQKSQKKIFTETEITEMKKNLKNYIIPMVEKFWKQTNFPPYTSIKITKSEWRWWSCSSKNSLNFSYRLAEFLPHNTDFIDAVIIHEICHLQEKNHSQKFWNLVYNLCPDYKNIIKNQEIF